MKRSCKYNYGGNKFKMKSICKKIVLILLVTIMFLPNIDAKTFSKKVCKQYAYDLVIQKYHWSIRDYNDLVKLWNKESGWNAKAYNKRTNSCGIAQASPCSKMKKYGKDYRTNCKVQIKWGLNYIKKKYKTPTKAWKSFKKKGWY